MADRRSSATKSAGQAPSTTQTTKQKAAAAVSAQQANKGLSQKQLAEKYGGRYSENGKIIRVDPGEPSGRNISVTINERLGFSDEVQTAQTINRTIESRKEDAPAINEERRVEQQTGKTIQQLETNKKKGKDLSVTLEEGFSFSEAVGQPKGAVAPFGAGFTLGASRSDTVFAKKGKLKPEEPFTFDTFTENLKKAFSPEGVESSRETLIGLGEEIKNFGLAGIKETVKYGSTNIYTSGRVIPSEQTKEINKFIEKNTAKDTFTEKVFEGKFSEIDISNPRTRGNIYFYPLTAAVGGIPKAVGKVGERIAVSAEKKGVDVYSKFLKSIGEPFGLERVGGTIKGEKTITLVPKEGGGKSYQFTKRFDIQKPITGEGTYITTGGIEEKPTSINILKFGKRQPGFEKERVTVKDITPTGERLPTQSPNELNIQGKLDRYSRKELGVKEIAGQQGIVKNLYTTGKTTKANRYAYQSGLADKEIIEIAKGVKAPLKNVVTGKNLKDYVSGSKRYSSVYSQTKALKLEPETKAMGPSKGPKTPFPDFTSQPQSKIGAGGFGKAKSYFTKEEAKSLRESEITKTLSEQKGKQELDILFQGPREFRQSAGGVILPSYQEPKYETPTRQKETGVMGVEDFIKAKVIPSRATKDFGLLSFTDVLSTQVTRNNKQKQSEALGFADAFEYTKITGQPQKEKQDESFKFLEGFDYKKGRLDIPGPPPPDNPPPPPTQRLPPIIPLGVPPGFFGSGLGDNRESAKRYYAAYGISSDINVKVLPTFSRYGKSSTVFKKQQKEDERIQKLFYGSYTKPSKKKTRYVIVKGKAYPKGSKSKTTKPKRKRSKRK